MLKGSGWVGANPPFGRPKMAEFWTSVEASAETLAPRNPAGKKCNRSKNRPSETLRGRCASAQSNALLLVGAEHVQVGLILFLDGLRTTSAM